MQLVVLVLAAAVLYGWSRTFALSALLGGAAYLMPQTWFAWQAFRYRGARSTSGILRAFYRGETGKYLLTAATFAAVFATIRPLDVLALFGAYTGIMAVNLVLMPTGMSRETEHE